MEFKTVLTVSINGPIQSSSCAPIKKQLDHRIFKIINRLPPILSSIVKCFVHFFQIQAKEQDEPKAHDSPAIFGIGLLVHEALATNAD
jgi:hypothetical protein